MRTPPVSRRALRSQAGIAVPVAMSVMLVALVLVGVAMAAAISTNTFSNRDTSAKTAVEAADAGLRTAVYRLNMYRPGANQCPDPPADDLVGTNGAPAAALCAPVSGSLGNGATFTYWISRAMQSGDACAGPTVGSADSVVQRCITATGSVNGQSARLQERVAAYTSTPVFPTAIFGTASVTISTNVNIATNSSGSPALMGTNGLLTVGSGNGCGGTVIDGYQLPPGASTQICPGVTNNGPTTGIASNYANPTSVNTYQTSQNTQSPYYSAATSQAGTCAEWEAQALGWLGSDASWRQTNCDYRIQRGITYPQCMNGAATVPDCDPSSRIVAADFDPTNRTLYLPNNANLTLGSGVYNFCSLYLGQNAVITIAQGAKVAIYIDSPADTSSGGPNCSGSSSALGVAPGTFTMTQNAVVNAGGSALSAQIYVYGNPDTPGANTVLLNNNGSSSFALDAPFSDVQLDPSNNTTFIGAIVGNSVEIGNAAHFTYESDAQTLQTGSLDLYYRSFWEQCPAQPSSAGDPTSGC